MKYKLRKTDLDADFSKNAISEIGHHPEKIENFCLAK